MRNRNKYYFPGDVDHSWFQEHKSVAFLIAIFVTGVLLAFAAYYLGNWSRILSEVARQIAGILLTACTISVLFVFRDVRDAFVATLSRLLGHGEIIKYLPEAVRDELERAIIVQDSAHSVASLNPELYTYIKSVQQTSHRSPVMFNYHENVNLSPSRDAIGFFEYSDLISYILVADHFPDQTAQIPYRFSFTQANPEGAPIESVKSKLRFKGTFGKKEYGVDQLHFKSMMVGSTPLVLCSLILDLTITRTMEVRLNFYGISADWDNLQVTYVRYPCKGFSVTLHYLPNLCYDCTWFTHWHDISEPFPKCGEQQIDQTGITATTNDWLLPGQGVALTWYHKPGHS